MKPQTIPLLFLALVLAACGRSKPSVIEPAPSDSPTSTISATAAKPPPPSPTPTGPGEGITIVKETPLPPPTNTPLPPKATPVFIGTAIPDAPQPVGAANLGQLGNVAQWGRGRIIDAAFSPDNSFFVVGSASGVMVYDRQNLAEPPRWLPFVSPFAYEYFYISTDGRYLKLVMTSYVSWGTQYDRRGQEQYLDLDSGQRIAEPPDVDWPVPEFDSDYMQGITVYSPDGSMYFKGGRTGINMEAFYEEHGYWPWTEETAFRDVYDTASGELLYELGDPVIYITIDDRSGPEGCDLAIFSPCGNALMDIVSSPYRAAFSPDGSRLGVLYRSPSIRNTNDYSELHLYDAANGALLEVIGSLDDPVEDFAFGPDANTLLVAYVDGSVQLHDLAAPNLIFTAWHFSSPVWYYAFSPSGEFLLVQRPGILEVRRRTTGDLVGRYDSTAFAVAPNEDLAAIADPDGLIRIREIATGERLRQLRGHSDRVFSLTFSPDGKLIASSSQDCTTRLWDAQSGKFLHFFEKAVVDAYGFQPSRIFVWYLKFLPEANRLIGFGSWGTVVSWDLNTGVKDFVIESAPLEFYQGMITVKPHFPEHFRADLDRSRFYIDDSAYDLDTGEFLGKEPLDQAAQPEETSIKDCYHTGVFSLDGKIEFGVGYEGQEGKICLIDAEVQELINTVEVIPHATAHTLWVQWLTLSPDGDQLYLGLNNGVISIYQVVE